MKLNARTIPGTLALATALGLTVVLGGCATQPEPTAAEQKTDVGELASAGDAEKGTMIATSFGKGSYSDGDSAVVSFIYDAELDDAGQASGFFRHQGSYGDGKIDLSGQVSCVSFDHPEGRAWIAGTVSANNSTTDFANNKTLPVGSIVGFVVEDASVAITGSIEFPRRLTGKEETSAQRYCEARKWPTGGLNTVTAGTLGVFP